MLIGASDYFPSADKGFLHIYCILFTNTTRERYVLVGEPKSRIVQKHNFFAPERYTAGILYTDSLNIA